MNKNKNFPFPKKIVISLPHLKAGGTERVASELANYLSVDMEIYVLLMYKENIFYNLGKNVTLIAPIDYRKKYGKFISVFFILFYLRKQMKQIKPDAVFLLGYISLGLISTVALKTKVIISERSSPDRKRFPHNFLLNYIYLIQKWILRGRVDGIIAQTQYAKIKYGNKYKCPIQVIPNFLRKKTSKEEKITSKENIIINVGRLVFEKNQTDLLKCFSLLNTYKKWKLQLLGDGPMRNDLERLAKDLDITDSVEFLGFQKDVDYYLRRAKILGYTSIIEGFPNAIIEAMANGVVPVSYDCIAGPSEIIENNKNGFLVEVGNIEDMRNKINDLISDKTFYNTLSLQAIIDSKKYSLDKNSKRI